MGSARRSAQEWVRRAGGSVARRIAGTVADGLAGPAAAPARTAADRLAGAASQRFDPAAADHPAPAAPGQGSAAVGFRHGVRRPLAGAQFRTQSGVEPSAAARFPGADGHVTRGSAGSAISIGSATATVSTGALAAAFGGSAPGAGSPAAAPAPSAARGEGACRRTAAGDGGAAAAPDFGNSFAVRDAARGTQAAGTIDRAAAAARGAAAPRARRAVAAGARCRLFRRLSHSLSACPGRSGSRARPPKHAAAAACARACGAARRGGNDRSVVRPGRGWLADAVLVGADRWCRGQHRLAQPRQRLVASATPTIPRRPG